MQASGDSIHPSLMTRSYVHHYHQTEDPLCKIKDEQREKVTHDQDARRESKALVNTFEN